MIERKNGVLVKLRNIMTATVSAAVCVLILVYYAAASDAVLRGIVICCKSVIPSLFPMMFMAQYIVLSGTADLAGGVLERPVRFLLGLPGVCGVALLTAFVGGYPAGAKAAEALVKEGRITLRDGQRLASLAFCSGPGFAIGMIGGELYKNKTVGLLILTAQAFSCIIIGIVYRMIRAGGRSADVSCRAEKTTGRLQPDAFVRSASGTASTLLNMCSFIIMFQVIASLLDETGVNAALGWITEKAGFGSVGRILLPCTLEVTGGSFQSVKYGIPLTAFVVGFGGLSVHFQNFAICPSVRPDKTQYLFTRIAQGVLCSLMVRLGLELPCFSGAVIAVSSAAAEGIPAEFSGVSVGFGCSMLVMCLMSVICLPEKERIKP